MEHLFVPSTTCDPAGTSSAICCVNKGCQLYPRPPLRPTTCIQSHSECTANVKEESAQELYLLGCAFILPNSPSNSIERWAVEKCSINELRWVRFSYAHRYFIKDFSPPSLNLIGKAELGATYA